jgi:hypothetical protein
MQLSATTRGHVCGVYRLMAKGKKGKSTTEAAAAALPPPSTPHGRPAPAAVPTPSSPQTKAHQPLVPSSIAAPPPPSARVAVHPGRYVAELCPLSFEGCLVLLLCTLPTRALLTAFSSHHWKLWCGILWRNAQSHEQVRRARHHESASAPAAVAVRPERFCERSHIPVAAAAPLPYSRAVMRSQSFERSVAGRPRMQCDGAHGRVRRVPVPCPSLPDT